MGTRTSKFDWSSTNSYERAQGAEITGFAWECLRRNQIINATVAASPRPPL
ncbi:MULTISPECIES: transcriptional regulator domain-containing protein [unclassified Bradyrhizobium]|uniref:transcriptional regulator domain-containing protein n=1 Tax=unclassified Bradyrhizobium TaxID=2631580 RepID=UPI003D1DF265